MAEEIQPVDCSNALPDAGRADPATEPASVERRVCRNIVIVIVAAVAVAAALADLRFALGVGVGGALALFNYRWLRSSVRAIMESGERKAPPGTSMKFLFRWLVVGFVVYVLTRTGYLDPVPMLAGLFAPGAAIMIEAGYVVYRTLVHNGER